MAQIIGSFPELAESVPVTPSIGLLVSRQSALLTYAADRTMELYSQALLGAFRAFWDNDVPVLIVHEDDVDQGQLPPGIRALYWPMPIAGSVSLAESLTRFVDSGGTLVAEASPALHVDHGHTSPRVPGLGLGELFGAEEIEADVTEALIFQLEGGERLEGRWMREFLRATTARIWGRFADGSPAVAENEYGRGKAVLVATYPSLAYEESRSPETGRWIALASGQALPPIQQTPPVSGLHTSLHQHGEGLIVFAINWSDDPIHTKLLLRRGRVRSCRPSPGLAASNDGVAIDLAPRSGGMAALEVSLEEEAVNDHHR